ncbi:MAG: MgtE intracellular N domain protein [bacterium ADurb.Bin236]|nr:MAG: MgtE intracellular N domain protein [bacterium ADurb.Bin236]
MLDMAKKAVKTEERAQPEASGRGSTWLWVGLAGVSVLLLIAVLHLSGALRGPEEAIYRSTKNVPVLSFFTRPLHRESWKEIMTPEQTIDVKQLYAKLERAERQIENLQKATRKINGVAADIDEMKVGMEKMAAGMKSLSDGEIDIEVQPAAAPVASQAIAATAPQALPGAGIPELVSPVGSQNYRLIAKIFENLPADTTVDILNNLNDDEKVGILAAMKDKTVADILAAFDPVKSAQLARMLARARG